MRIGINVSWMTPGQAGGMEGYVRNLVRELAQVDQENRYVLVTGHNNFRTFELPSDRWKMVVYLGTENSPRTFQLTLDAHPASGEVHALRRFVRQLRVWWKYPKELLRWIYRRYRLLGTPYWAGGLAELIRREKIDLWFCPLMYALPLDSPVPVVNTIPDLQQEHYPAFFVEPERGFRALGYRYSCTAAAATLGISQFVADDIVERYKIDPGKVFATPLALDPSFEADEERLVDLAAHARLQYRLHPQRELILYPANGWRHKNHENLVRALAIAHERGSQVDLLLTGAAFDVMKRLQPLIREHGLQGYVRHLGYVGKDELLGLFSSARMLALPSLFEGFGLPVLEAMAVGLPVACSDVGSLPEVGGEAVRYFDPDDPESIAQAILDLSTSPELRERLIAAGKEQVKRFSYQRTARETLEVFERVADGSLPRPKLPPCQPLIPHNWLSLGFGRWYFHVPDLERVELELEQPTPLPGLANQRVSATLDGGGPESVAVAPKKKSRIRLRAEERHRDSLHRLEILADSIAAVRGEQLSVQVVSAVAVDRSGRETRLVG